LALDQVRDEVMEATRLRQEPFLYGSLGGRAVSIVSGSPTNPSTPSDLAERAWAVTQNTASVPLIWPRSRCEEEFPDNTPPPECAARMQGCYAAGACVAKGR